MSFVVNIASRLENQEKFLQIGRNEGDVIKVYDDKNTFLKVQEILSKETDLKGMDQALELLVKKEGMKKINDMKLSVTAYQDLFIGVMACVQGKPFEDVEKQFRNSLK